MSREEFEETLGIAIDEISADIRKLELERDWHLRAPWEGRLCNRGAWHHRLYRLNQQLVSLRVDRASLLVELAEDA